MEIEENTPTKQDTNTQNQNKDSTKKNNTQNQVPQTQK